MPETCGCGTDRASGHERPRVFTQPNAYNIVTLFSCSTLLHLTLTLYRLFATIIDTFRKRDDDEGISALWVLPTPTTKSALEMLLYLRKEWEKITNKQKLKKKPPNKINLKH